MQTSTVLLIILAAIVAMGLVLFQYYFKSKKRGKLLVFLSFLRFLSVFGILLLLINPKFSQNQYTLEKTNLIVLSDNSSSVAKFRNTIQKVLDTLNGNSDLSDKFKIEHYNFGNSIQQSDSLSFLEKSTDISKALRSLNQVYANTNTTVIMLSDGNSTIGENYVFSGEATKFSIHPIAIGDTTKHEDLRIDQVNSNKYAFLKNKYPLEVYVSYEGNNKVSAILSIQANGKNVYRKNIELSNTDNTKKINALLDANSVGIKNLSISISSLDKERNTQNNKRNTIVEVIDEKTNIAIISSLNHPDIGALRKSIESNEQRSVRLIKPTANLKDLDDVDVCILYQPNASFNSIYNHLKNKKTSVFIIGGTKTKWSSINKVATNYKVTDGYPIQEVSGVLNPSFTKFDITGFDMDDFPPLGSNAGTIQINDAESLIQMKIFGATLKSPLLFAFEKDNNKKVILAGENIWKWRMQSFRNNQNFQNFDDFIGKLMLYLSSNKGKRRLNVEYESVYEGSNTAKIKASYFDEAFVFNTNASLVLKLKNIEKGSTQEIPMLLKNNFYEADLTDILPGQYSFSVNVENENKTQTGSFTILDFDVEKQFLSTDNEKLEQLASSTNGKLYYPNTTNGLVQSLLNDNRFVPTQKATKNIVSLIDFRVLLAIIITALAAEWFIRKYNGLT